MCILPLISLSCTSYLVFCLAGTTRYTFVSNLFKLLCCNTIIRTLLDLPSWLPFHSNAPTSSCLNTVVTGLQLHLLYPIKISAFECEELPFSSTFVLLALKQGVYEVTQAANAIRHMFAAHNQRQRVKSSLISTEGIGIPLEYSQEVPVRRLRPHEAVVEPILRSTLPRFAITLQHLERASLVQLPYKFIARLHALS